jgi:hypothetical protein
MPASVAVASMEAAEAVAFMAVVAAVVADADGGYFIL